MNEFEMPENYVCSCSEGRAYDKESEVCQKCVKAGMALDFLFEKLAKDGTPEMLSALMLIMLEKKLGMEKDEKEEGFENE